MVESDGTPRADATQGGLFTLSARLVDGAGAGRCRKPGAVSDQVLAGRRGAGRGWGPRSTGRGRVRNPRRPNPRRPSSRGSRVRLQLNLTRITRLPSCSRASTAARGRDADQGPNARQLGDGVGSVVRDSRQRE